LEVQKFYHPKDQRVSFAEAARIYFNCRRKGVTIRSTIDCIIAQTAIEYDLLLLHNDRDFDAIAKIVALKFY
jgi:predicted nucleic acid-binding protein